MVLQFTDPFRGVTMKRRHSPRARGRVESNTSMMRIRLQRAAWLVVLALHLLSPQADADRIILRSGDFITGKTVKSFDEDGVKLDDGMLVQWQDISRGRVAEDQQSAFDKMLADVGDDLFRIRQRLSVGDYEGLLTHAEAIEKRYAGRTSDTAAMVLHALIWGRLEAGQREAAVAPYLRCYQLFRARRTTKIDLPGERRLQFNPKTGMSPDLLPIWFDKAVAMSAMKEVSTVIRTIPVKQRPAGVYIYFASLATAAGQTKNVSRLLDAVQGDDATLAEFQNILRAEGELAVGKDGPALEQLRTNVADLSRETKPLALYCLGRAKLKSPDYETQQQAVLDLLRIPALYGKRQPELSAAALFAAMTKLTEMKDVRGSIAIRGELLSEYGNTYFARQVNRQASRPKTP